MTKRLILLTALISIALVGCNNDKETSSTAENSIESSVPVETTTTEPTVESKSTPEPTVESTSTIEPTLSTNTSTTSGSSMGQMSAPDIQSDDFVVEAFGPQTMYVIDSVTPMEGPSESDFHDMGYLWKNEAVSVIGVVKSYKGEECLWYRLNTGEFVRSECLTTEKPANASDIVGGEETSPISNEGTPTTNQDNQEFPPLDLDDILGGTPSTNNNTSTTDDGRPFAQHNPDWVGGGDAPSTHVWSN